jgi:hypothetical protein
MGAHSFVDPDPHHFGSASKPDLHQNPDPHQSDNLDLGPDPDPHQFADHKLKCKEYGPIWVLFQGSSLYLVSGSGTGSASG